MEGTKRTSPTTDQRPSRGARRWDWLLVPPLWRRHRPRPLRRHRRLHHPLQVELVMILMMFLLTNNDLDDKEDDDDDDVLVHQLSIISAAGKWRVESTTSLWFTRSSRTRWSSPLSTWTLSSSPPLSNPRDQAGQGEEDISHRASVCIDVVSVIIATNHPDTSLEKNTWIAMSEILQVAGWSWKQKWWPLVKQTHKVSDGWWSCWWS